MTRAIFLGTGGSSVSREAMSGRGRSGGCYMV